METVTTPATQTQKTGGPAPKRSYPALFEKLCDEAIPVARLTFTVSRPAGPDLPIPRINGGIARLEASANVKIDLIPKLHCFRLIIKHPDARVAPDGEVVHMVPREWASWEPLERP